MTGMDAATVDHLVHTFSRCERQVLALYYCEELTTAEIGQVLDMPELEVVDALDKMQRATRDALAPSVC